ncbi:MAG: zinc ribbon domain-containing protein [Dehalococcoidia bacterium]|nr:MAG: zinc ribbon domain-containing protein [Dehalococcoidia bacterium]
MYCTQCGNQVPEGNRFCTNCGVAVSAGGTACPNCGSAVSPGMGHCSRCGQILVGGAAEERKRGVKAVVGGILGTVAGVFGLVIGILILAGVTQATSQHPLIEEDISWLNTIGVLYIIIGLLAILGSALAIARMGFWLAIIGTICTIPIVPMLGIPALILVAISKKDF